MTSLADNLEPPYYAAIIENAPNDNDEKAITPADRLVTLAVQRPGFLGLETARGVDGRSLTVAYWRDIADVEGWTMAGQANSDDALDVEVKHVANAADNTARALYVVPEHSRALWRYT